MFFENAGKRANITILFPAQSLSCTFPKTGRLLSGTVCRSLTGTDKRDHNAERAPSGSSLVASATHTAHPQVQLQLHFLHILLDRAYARDM